jgi:acetyl-CoA acetyltransferase
MERLRLKIGDFDLIEINEAFASPLACLRQLGLPDDAEHELLVAPSRWGIRCMSGRALVLTAARPGKRAAGVPWPPCASASGRGFRWL